MVSPGPRPQPLLDINVHHMDSVADTPTVRDFDKNDAKAWWPVSALLVAVIYTGSKSLVSTQPRSKDLGLIGS